MPHSHSKFEQAAQLVFPHCKLIDVLPLTGGISAETYRLTLETDAGTSDIVLRHLRRRPDNASASAEFKLLHALSTGDVRVPRPLYWGASGSLFAGPFIMMEYVAGSLNIAPSDLQSYLTQCADQLAHLHQLPPEQFHFVGKVEEANSELSRGNRHNALCDTKPLRELIAQHRLTMRNGPRLLHGDYWPGNLLWRDEALAAVVDWEDAALGDPLVDLAIARLDVATMFGIVSAETFTTRYLSQNRIDTADLAYWDLCACLRISRVVGDDLSDWVSGFIDMNRPDITENFYHSNYNSFMHQALKRLTT